MLALTKHFRSTLILLLTTFMISEAQVAPVTAPIGGFKIDGYLERQGPEGDWVKGNPPFDAPGTFLFASGSGLLQIVDPWDFDGDDVFSRAGFNENPNTFKWIFKKARPATDINNGLFFLTTDAYNNVWAILSADRYKKGNTTTYIDFEFLQSPVLATLDPLSKNDQFYKSGGFISYGPHGGRTIGDVLLTLSFDKSGGTFLSVFTYVWKADPNGGYSYHEAFAPGFGATNSTTPVNVPYGAFGSTVYPTQSFGEMALNMTAATGGATCLTKENTFRTIWIKSKTRSGNGFSYDDFLTPFQLKVSNDYTLTADVTFFDLVSAQLTAAVAPGDINDYNFHWSAIGASINDVIDPNVTGTLNNYDIYNPI
ncbi:MAG TPA: hypothetical protein VKB95_03340, partial [Chitinophagaceae bacterium]|nr:hypothetical protein [Chitinophagaceae bacterium]